MPHYYIYQKPPSIKSRDTRCSHACVKNWTKYQQFPPIGHYCQCSKPFTPLPKFKH